MTEASEFVWYELLTPNADAARAFYAKVVGWGTIDTGMDNGYSLLTVGETQIGGLMGLTSDMKAMGTPPAWRGFISAPDVDDYAKRVTAAGGQVLRGPMPVPSGVWVLHANDPQGVFFALSGPKV